MSTLPIDVSAVYRSQSISLVDIHTCFYTSAGRRERSRNGEVGSEHDEGGRPVAGQRTKQHVQPQQDRNKQISRKLLKTQGQINLFF